MLFIRTHYFVIQHESALFNNGGILYWVMIKQWFIMLLALLVCESLSDNLWLPVSNMKLDSFEIKVSILNGLVTGVLYV